MAGAHLPGFIAVGRGDREGSRCDCVILIDLAGGHIGVAAAGRTKYISAKTGVAVPEKPESTGAKYIPSLSLVGAAGQAVDGHAVRARSPASAYLPRNGEHIQAVEAKEVAAGKEAIRAGRGESQGSEETNLIQLVGIEPAVKVVPGIAAVEALEYPADKPELLWVPT